MKRKPEFREFTSPSGRSARLYTLINVKGNFVNILTLGGIIQSWSVINSGNRVTDIVLGMQDCSQYFMPHPSFGSLIGPFANRIANGRYSYGGVAYQLSQNNGRHHLHGGYRNLAGMIWDAPESGDNFLILETVHRAGEDGYPGNLTIKVKYTYSDDDTLKIEYFATTDFPRPVNLTSHPYFNLSGEPRNSVLKNRLFVNSDSITETDQEGIPTGAFTHLTDDFLNFSSFNEIEAVVKRSGLAGLDHNFVLKEQAEDTRLAASLICPVGKLQLDVFTTEPGLQIYTGNGLNGAFVNKNGSMISQYSGICLEPQHFPDSPNHLHFPDTILKPGEEYKSRIAYKISEITS